METTIAEYPINWIEVDCPTCGEPLLFEAYEGSARTDPYTDCIRRGCDCHWSSAHRELGEEVMERYQRALRQDGEGR